MSEDIKAKLKEKLGAAVGEDELDKVAGGSFDENMDILAAMAKVDPDGVQAIVDSIPKNESHWKDRIAHETGQLLLKNGIFSSISTEYNNDYELFNGERISHTELLRRIEGIAIAKRQ